LATVPTPQAESSPTPVTVPQVLATQLATLFAPWQVEAVVHTGAEL
jgi:hypothetical protein